MLFIEEKKFKKDSSNISISLPILPPPVNNKKASKFFDNENLKPGTIKNKQVFFKYVYKIIYFFYRE